MRGHRFHRRGARTSPGAVEPMESADHRPGARSLPGGDGGGVAASQGAVCRVSQVEPRADPLRAVAPILQPAEGRAGGSAPDGSRARPGVVDPPEEVWPRYWWRLAATWHMVGGYRTELDITDRWHDSADAGWQIVRGRALSALGRERDVMDLFRSTSRGSVDVVAVPQLTIADGARGARTPDDRDGGCREHSLARLELYPPLIGSASRILPGRIGCSAARPASGKRSSGCFGAMPTRWPSWKRWAGSRCCSPTRPRRTGSTASCNERATGH